MTISTKAERRLAHEQALASTRISGHEPTPEFLADCEAVIEGTMTREEARAASLARALAMSKSDASCGDVVDLAAAVDLSRVDEALQGLRPTEELTDAECDQYFDSLIEVLWNGPADNELFVRLRAEGRGVGLDENDHFVYGFAEIPHCFRESTTETAPALTPLSLEQQAAYAAAVEQILPIFSLAGIEPSPQDAAITVAICEGRVTSEEAREELLSFLLERKTTYGFIESRSWGVGLPTPMWLPGKGQASRAQ